MFFWMDFRKVIVVWLLIYVLIVLKMLLRIIIEKKIYMILKYIVMGDS